MQAVKKSAIKWAWNLISELSKMTEIISEFRDDFVSMAEAIMEEFSQGAFIDMTLDDKVIEKVATLK